MVAGQQGQDDFDLLSIHSDRKLVFEDDSLNYNALTFNADRVRVTFSVA
jgi:hypothetical protein